MEHLWGKLALSTANPHTSLADYGFSFKAFFMALEFSSPILAV